MKVKLSKLLPILLILLAFVPTASAALHDDQWFIDNAKTGVESEYGYSDVTWSGSVTSGWHNSPPVISHKHVELAGTYGYEDTGKITWDGRIYDNGEIYTINHAQTEPEHRKVTLRTTIVNPQYRYVWNGKGYILNPGMHSYWLDGRFYVVYPAT